MTFIWILLGLAGLLLVIHMAHTRYEPRKLSAARFFKDLPEAIQSKRQWTPGNPLRSRPLYLQLLLIGLIVAALLFTFVDGWNGRERPSDQGIGVWVFLDTSASMSTQQNGLSRMDIAYLIVAAGYLQATEAGKGLDVCFRWATFDLALNKMPDQAALMAATPRPLGTDTHLVQNAVNSLQETNTLQSECPITHVLVVTDSPAPTWLTEVTHVPIIWQDVSMPVDNWGFQDIRATRDPLTGLTSDVTIEIAIYGIMPDNMTLTILAPTGEEMSPEWEQSEGVVRRARFTPTQPGEYQLTITPGGAYGYDDTAIILVQEVDKLRVDWQLPDTTLPQLLDWDISPGIPSLRVVTEGTDWQDDVPTLVVGNGYEHLANIPILIDYFVEGSPLLTDVNLDAVETLGLPGSQLPSGFSLVLQGKNAGVWLAQRSNPPAAYIPGLPQLRDDNLGRFSTLVFLNGVRWLSQSQPPVPLYELTSPAAPEVTPGHLPFHPGEGNTSQPPRMQGAVADIQPATTIGRVNPIWHYFLTVAVLLFAIERGLAAFGGDKWH